MTKTTLLLLSVFMSSSVSTVFPVDALLVFIIVFSLTLRELKSFTFSLFYGAVSDLAVPGAAPVAPCYACLGLAQSICARFIFRANILVVLVFVLLATFLKGIYLLAFSSLPISASEIQHAIPGLMKEMLGNIIIAPLFYFILLKK